MKITHQELDDIVSKEIKKNTESVNVLSGIGIFTESFPKLNGEVDDSKRFQRALNEAVSKGIDKLILTGNSYTFNSPIDMTNIRNGLVVEGMNERTVIKANTGGICFDATGSQKIKLKNIKIIGGDTNPSTLGVLFARSSANIYSEFNSLDNVEIELPSIPSANGGVGTIGIYNCASEVGNARDITISTDLPIVFTNTNIRRVSSPFTTDHVVGTDFMSMSEWVIAGKSTLRPKTQVACLLDNVTSISIDAYVLLDGDIETPSAEYAYEIRNTSLKISITGHIENFKKSILVNGDTELGTYLTDFNVHVTKQVFSQDDDQLVLDGRAGTTGIFGGSINIIPTNNDYIHNAIAQWGISHIGVMNCDIVLHETQGLSLPEGKTTSNNIKAFEAYPNITLSDTNNGTTVSRQDRVVTYGETDVDVLIIHNRYLLGGSVHAYGGGEPTDGEWNTGDRIINNYPTELGEDGSKYIISEWACTEGGEPGIWLPLRCLTGN